MEWVLMERSHQALYTLLEARPWVREQLQEPAT